MLETQSFRKKYKKLSIKSNTSALYSRIQEKQKSKIVHQWIYNVIAFDKVKSGIRKGILSKNIRLCIFYFSHLFFTISATSPQGILVLHISLEPVVRVSYSYERLGSMSSWVANGITSFEHILYIPNSSRLDYSWKLYKPFTFEENLVFETCLFESSM